jgi:heme exporter protein B
MSGAGPLRAALAVAARDLTLAFRRPGEWLQPVAFFLIVTMLFPLALDPELARLRQIAPGALWVAALLSSLLAIEFLFRDDGRDGTLEQFALSGQSFAWLLLAKTVSHWLLTGLPLALAAPLAAVGLGAPAAAIPGILAALLLGSVSLSLIGAIGAGAGRCCRCSCCLWRSRRSYLAQGPRTWRSGASRWPPRSTCWRPWRYSD